METIIHQEKLNNINQTLLGLNLFELDSVMKRVVRLRKQKTPTVLSTTETKLLRKINKGIPKEIQNRYDFLLKRKIAEELEEDEYDELLKFTSYMESLNVQRLENLLELAKFRNETLDSVIEQLELKTELYVV